MNMQNMDYTLIIDRSGSMDTNDQPGGKSRWDVAQESTLAVARKIEQLDPDGINVYVFAGKHKAYKNVTSAKVAQIFQENSPLGSTNLAGVLKAAFEDFLSRKSSGQLKDGELIIVVTDGDPDDRKAVYKSIIEVTRKMDSDEQLTVLFLQIGNDLSAAEFMHSLDNQLQGDGLAKFDIVDVKTFADLEDMTLMEALENAIVD
jgi:hypothetical protein